MRIISGKDDGPIPGINNYCDEWCERCPFVSRCPGPADDDFPEFAEHDLTGLEDKINLLIENTERIIAHFNISYPVKINLDIIPELNITRKQLRITMLDKIADPLMNDFEKYKKEAVKYLQDWSNCNEEDKGIWMPDFGQVHSNPLGEYEYEEVIEYYLPLIETRILTALNIQKESGICVDSQDNIIEYNGVIKCALLMLENSRLAWDQLLEKNADSINEMISVYINLDVLKQSLLNRFPGCMEFIRPGLDET